VAESESQYGPHSASTDSRTDCFPRLVPDYFIPYLRTPLKFADRRSPEFPRLLFPPAPLSALLPFILYLCGARCARGSGGTKGLGCRPTRSSFPCLDAECDQQNHIRTVASWTALTASSCPARQRLLFGNRIEKKLSTYKYAFGTLFSRLKEAIFTVDIGSREGRKQAVACICVY